MEKKISVAIPYYNNSEFMDKTLETLIIDNRISEIVIVDDNSQDLNKLEYLLEKLNSKKIILYKNEKNLGCYHNKIKTVSKCTNDWCILLDSDNYIEKSYIDILYKLENWDTNIIYSPDKPITFPGEPSYIMDYRKYSNKLIDKNIYINDFHENTFQCLINNCNYFLPCKEYLLCMEEKSKKYDRNIIDCLDSAVLFTDWLLNNKSIKIVKDLSYFHRLHKNSNYVRGKSRNYETIVKIQLLNKIKLL